MHLSTRRPPVFAGVILLFAAVVSLLLPLAASANAAITYTCGTPNDTTPHCYGKYAEYTNAVTPPTGTTSYGFSTFYGAYTQPNVVQLTGLSDSWALLNEEVWLEDAKMSGSQAPWHQCYMKWDSVNHAYDGTTASICWAETGYQLVGNGYTGNTNHGHEAWFASVVRPLDGFDQTTTPVTYPHCDPGWTGSCAYINVYGPQLLSTDYGNSFGTEEVYFDATTSHQVDTYEASTSTGLSGTISDDYMTPTEIDIGTELGGTNGLNGPKVHFKTNEYQSSLNGTWRYQTNDGFVVNNNPPLAGWTSGKKPSQSATGGDFETCVFTSCTL